MEFFKGPPGQLGAPGFTHLCKSAPDSRGYIRQAQKSALTWNSAGIGLCFRLNCFDFTSIDWDTAFIFSNFRFYWGTADLYWGHVPQ